MADELQGFLSQWKEELQGNIGQAQSSRKRDAAHQSMSGPSSPSEHDDCHLAKRLVVGINDAPPLLVLPAVGSLNPQGKEEGRKMDPLGKKSRKMDKNEEDLVCKLIADLDEINTIPFFEVQLPREIALVIFGYLSMRDLCHCAMVSKSWNSLAEDDLLWYRHYQKLLLKLKNRKLEAKSEWKSAVQDLIFQRQQVVKNWRERICGLSDYQPDDCRALCCFSYSNSTILSCYSSGAVCVWDLTAENGPSRARQPAGPHLISEPSCCDLVFPWGVFANPLEINDGELPMASLPGKSVSPLLCYNLLNIIYAYAYTVRLHDNGHHELPELASQTVMDISTCLSLNQSFETVGEALQAAMATIQQSRDLFNSRSFSAAIIADVSCIMRCTKSCANYVTRSLADLHKLFGKALSKKKPTKKDGEGKILRLARKKVYFFLAWANSQENLAHYKLLADSVNLEYENELESIHIESESRKESEKSQRMNIVNGKKHVTFANTKDKLKKLVEEI